MIQANKASVVTNFHKSTLEVRQLEIDYYLNVFDKLSSVAAFLAGFSSSALTVSLPLHDNPYLVTLFLLTTATSLGSHLLVVIACTMCTMWGPGHALKGEDASYVERAVWVLDTIKTSMERFFLFGLMCFFVSSILVVWLLFNTRGSVIVTSCLSICLLWMYCKASKIAAVLLPKKQASGRFNFNRIANVGYLMGDASGSLRGNLSSSWASHI
mmetsp:Transcript_86869/g.181846  ORF Transcript_86869/g.181846 Transcript_86869/m.181846 type:complete len:213 (+) Transcript_86869:85-723(+)